MKKEQWYRASVWAIIIDSNYNFLLVRLVWEKEEKYDFVKWWMYKWEDYEDTLKREIFEELWNDFKYEIIWKSSWYFFYDWSKELQERKWFRWQLRQNFWVKYISGNIILPLEELSDYKWVTKENIIEELRKSNFPESEIIKFKEDCKEKINIIL